MAAKKKAVKAKKATAKAPRAAPPTLAVKVLGQLPALDNRLRAAYRGSFSEEQCDAWGAETKSAEVVREAEKWIGAMFGTVKKQSVSGYSPRRLAWLSELVVSLQDEIAKSKAGSNGLHGATSSAMQVAQRVLTDLVGRLELVAGGRAELLELIRARGTSQRGSPQHVRDALTALIDLASKWRRDAALLLLAEDADLSEARLNAAYNALENLARAEEAAYEPPPTTDQDSAAVNRVEGRVLREMKLAASAFAQAKANGERVPALTPGPTVRSVLA